MRITLCLAILALVAGLAPAQGSVTTVNVAFVDGVTGTNVTNITLGQSVQWVFISGSFHTVTSGTGAADPTSGSLFNATLTSSGPFTFSYTPTECGTLPYYCVPHEGFGMTGTINVNPPPANYPGSGEDFELGTAISGSADGLTFGACNDIKTATGGDYLTVVSRSPLGGYDFSIYLLAADFVATGSVPFGPLGLTIAATSTVLVNGFTPGPLNTPQVISPGGTVTTFELPNGLAGNSLFIQSIAWAPGVANNGFFPVPDCHEIRMM